MKRLLFLLALPILACGGSAVPIAATITPFTPVLPTSTSAAGRLPETQPIPTATTEQIPPTAATNVSGFPNSTEFEWRIIAGGLNRPVDIQAAGDGSGRLFIIEKYGAIRVIENGDLLETPFLDITDRVNDNSNEMGLLGMAFDPQFEVNGFFYVNYTAAGGNTHISRFYAEGNRADANSETLLLTVDQPYPNHNGGVVAFGPDGYLYLGLGDGGLAGDPYKNGQNTNSLLGKILRIDVNEGHPYTIPADNPFGNEVWAYGLRNPWRMSFDSATGDLWIGDVGQGDWEEIDLLPAGSSGGANFGWSIMEGNHPYDGSAQPGLLLPVTEYSHEFGCAVTGGYVYRGSMPEWKGIYLYGDYCSGNIWGLLRKDAGWQNAIMFQTGFTINSFGVDESNELYIASDNGNVYRMVHK